MTQAIVTRDERQAGALARERELVAVMLAEDPRLQSAESRRTYAGALAEFAKVRAGAPVTRRAVERWAAAMLDEGLSPNTINKRLAAVRWYARRVADLVADESGLEPDERRERQAQALRAAEVGDVKGERALKGRNVEPGELAALMRACGDDETPAGVRDAALIAMGAALGLRVSEAAGLTLGALAWLADDELKVTLTRTKGNKVRELWLTNGAASALRDWLAVRGSGAPGDSLWLPVNKSGAIVREPMVRGRRPRPGAAAPSALKAPAMTPAALELMLQKRASEAGLDKPLSWHDFRRTFAGALLDAGADLVTVQKLMGHEEPSTTGKYDRRGDETKRKALRSLHVPYKARQ